MKKRVVVDTDAGTDDAVGILLLLTQESKNYEVVGITCTHGNTSLDNVCRNVLITLESIKRSDIPVFRGAQRPLLSADEREVKFQKYFHGKDGFGDKNLSPPTTAAQTENAIQALNRLASEGISVVCLGPLTNIALALRTYSEFSKNVVDVYIMGGNVMGTGNATPTAEFNFFADPEAAEIVLTSFNCPITVLPWESCLSDIMTLEERCNLPDTQPHMQLLNKVELDLYKGEPDWIPCDAFLAASFIDEKIIEKYRDLHLKVELNGYHTRGQGVICPQEPSNVRVIEEINKDIFKELITKMASYNPSKSPS